MGICITLETKVQLVKATVFAGVVYGCESWPIKKAEGQRTDAFELWCWWRLFRVPWTARRPNQSTLKKINPEYSLEGLMLKLKPQYFGHLMRRPWCWERFKAGEGDDRGWDGWMASPTQWTCVCANSGRWWRTGKPGELQSMGPQKVGHNLATEQKRELHLEFSMKEQTPCPLTCAVPCLRFSRQLSVLNYRTQYFNDRTTLLWWEMEARKFRGLSWMVDLIFFFRIVIHISLFLFESGLSWGAQTPKLWPHNRRDLSSPVRNGAQGPLHQKVDS